MSYTERVRYINTVKIASTNPAYKPQYDTLLTLHKTIFFNNGIHVLQFFLPWHRWFILQYENLLRQIDCRVTVPYWDWSLVGANPFSSSIWNTGAGGFGGNGVPGGSCVNTGPFRAAVWSLPASAGGGCLTRNFAGTAPDAIAVQNLISSNPNPTDLINFEDILRVQFHDEVHCIIDGTMCTTDSATAPEFFLHHAFVDKIWWQWQKQSNAHKFHTYFMAQAGLMSSTPYRSRDFLDLNNQPDCVCAEYIDPQNNAYRRIKCMFLVQHDMKINTEIAIQIIAQSKYFFSFSKAIRTIFILFCILSISSQPRFPHLPCNVYHLTRSLHSKVSLTSSPSSLLITSYHLNLASLTFSAMSTTSHPQISSLHNISDQLFIPSYYIVHIISTLLL